jgi:hypothetical protein
MILVSSDHKQPSVGQGKDEDVSICRDGRPAVATAFEIMRELNSKTSAATVIIKSSAIVHAYH